MFKVVRWLVYFIIVEFLILFLFVFNYINNGNDLSLLTNYIVDIRLFISFILFIIFMPIFYFKYKKFNIKENKLKNIHILILLGASLSAIYNVFGFYINKLINGNLYGVFDIKVILIITVLLGPILEEYLYRGIIYNEAKKIYSLKKSIIITTLVFAISHTNFIQIIYASILGYILIKIYEKCNNIKSCIIVHMVSNFTTTILTFILIKDKIILNMFIFIIGLVILLFIKDKKYDII